MIDSDEVKITEGLSGSVQIAEYVKYFEGKRLCPFHVDAVHAAGKDQDLYTGKLAEAIIKHCYCPGIIGTKSRNIADLNRPDDFIPVEGTIQMQREAIKQYRSFISLLLMTIGSLDRNGQLVRPHLHLALHGMVDDSRHGEQAIEIGTRHGTSCSPEVRDFVAQTVDEKARQIGLAINIVVDQEWIGDESKVFHRCGDTKSNYRGYGPNYHAVQIEISYTLRKSHQKELTEILSEVLEGFAVRFTGE